MRKKLNKEKEKIGKIGKKEKSKKKEKWKIKVISAGYTISARHLINYFFFLFSFSLYSFFIFSSIGLGFQFYSFSLLSFFLAVGFSPLDFEDVNRMLFL